MKLKMTLPPRGGYPPRRSFLKRGIFGAAILALGGGGYLFTRPSRSVALPAEGLRVLSPRGYAVLSAIAARMLPNHQGAPTVEELQVALKADTVLSLVDETAKKEVLQLLDLFENALPNFLFGFRTTPFTQLDAAEQDVVLSEWVSSRLALRRTGYMALRTLVMACYFGSSKAWPSVGYLGPPPGFHNPGAPVWKGEGPRPPSNGLWVEETTP